MAEYEKKVREVLKKHGCHFVRHGKGDHDIWYSPIMDTNVAVKRKNNVARLTPRYCCNWREEIYAKIARDIK